MQNFVHLVCSFEYSQNNSRILQQQKNATRLVSIIPFFKAYWKNGFFFSFVNPPLVGALRFLLIAGFLFYFVFVVFSLKLPKLVFSHPSFESCMRCSSSFMSSSRVSISLSLYQSLPGIHLSTALYLNAPSVPTRATLTHISSHLGYEYS